MERITKFDEKTKGYELKKQYTVQDLIRIIGEKEDALEKMAERSGKLLESTLELLEITKGEKEEIMQKLREVK